MTSQPMIHTFANHLAKLCRLCEFAIPSISQISRWRIGDCVLREIPFITLGHEPKWMFKFDCNSSLNSIFEHVQFERWFDPLFLIAGASGANPCLTLKLTDTSVSLRHTIVGNQGVQGNSLKTDTQSVASD